MPQSLARKRLWNKKYPICIELGKQDDFMSKAEGDRWEAGESFNTRGRGEGTGGVQERGSSSSSRDLTLYLFGRTGREKEEWFQRFLSASKLKVDLKKASSVAGTKSGEQNGFLCSRDICLLPQLTKKHFKNIDLSYFQRVKLFKWLFYKNVFIHNTAREMGI